MNITHIPLAQLEKAKTNVRTTRDPADIAELAANIASSGRLIQPLNGTWSNDTQTKCAIHAGATRLAALQLLDKQGRLPEVFHQGIPVIVTDDDRAEQLAVSLAENAVRTALTPLEEFKAFQKLHKAGFDTLSIANRYGVSEQVVHQRLALAGVHATILAAFEADKIELRALQAYTLEPSTAKQIRVFNELGPNAHARSIRTAIAAAGTPLTAAIAKFVGIDAYTNAGGGVRHDLFEPELSVLTDTDKLVELAEAQLQQAALPYVSAGWKWVEAIAGWSILSSHGFTRINGKLKELDDAQRAAREALRQEQATIEAQLEEYYENEDPSGEATASADKAEMRINEIENQLVAFEQREFTPADMSYAGVIVTYDRDGILTIYEGLIRKEDLKTAKASNTPNGAPSPGVTSPAEVPCEPGNVTSKAVYTAFNDCAEAMVQHAISKDGNVAEVIVTAYLAACVFRTQGLHNAGLQYPHHLKHTASSDFPITSDATFWEAHEGWAARIGNAEKPLIEELASWPPKERRALLSHCAAALYSRDNINSPDSIRFAERGTSVHEFLPSIMRINPRREISADETVFNRLSRANIAHALEDMGKGVASRLAHESKKELVGRAVAAAKQSKWLPASLRLEKPTDKLVFKVDDDADSDDETEEHSSDDQS